MARFELRFRTSVAKDLRGVPRADVKRILARIEALADDPRGPGCEKLGGAELYRARQGSYRIVVAVGTEIAPRPPHRSVRAELPHTAPASSHDAKRWCGYGWSTRARGR